ncbi:flagellar biosynthesis anti-sigma factor FlgM [Marinagarivorans cellulosilyticus]|uniref:Negative regulator of flagellin synthesis n=1 Tax=Marinagarivorans cellulosilyticus TaxID=2721545 RepID=A0AAN2BLL0_9GAMM|nr:flagellar biosynthesis anti-sigma factor FlgM [Marinagarivorans cellulosilyticus]BCD99258.1 negative regulator of flagellin synthesis FlgM [Marinagarivorans cellulosilyticus]
MVIDTGGVGKNRLHAPTQDTGKTRGPSADNASNSANAAQASSGDNVSLSGAGQAMSRLESKVQSSPEVDTAKVAAIKQSIANGSFSPNPSAIADKMLSDF